MPKEHAKGCFLQSLGKFYYGLALRSCKRDGERTSAKLVWRDGGKMKVWKWDEKMHIHTAPEGALCTHVHFHLWPCNGSCVTKGKKLMRVSINMSHTDLVIFVILYYMYMCVNSKRASVNYCIFKNLTRYA